MNQLHFQRLPAILTRLHADLKSHRISLDSDPATYLRGMIKKERKLSHSNLKAVLESMEQSIDPAQAGKCLAKILAEECHFQPESWEDSKEFCLSVFDSNGQPRTTSEVSLPFNDFAALADRWFAILTYHPRWSFVSTLYGAPIPIQELYTELYLVEDAPIQSDDDPTEFSIHPKTEAGGNSTQAVESVLARIQHRGVFVGDPGSGKSTLCKWIARYLVEDFKTVRLFPIPLRLHDYAVSLELDPKLNLLDFFLRNSCQIDSDELPKFQNLFPPENKERILFILDGWDEVPITLRTRVLSEIESTSSIGRILVTSRPSGIPSIVAQDADIVCQIGPLSNFAIRTLVTRICGKFNHSENAVPLFQQIDRHPQLRRLASNPFTLTLLTQIVCQGNFAIEELRTSTQLFEKAADLIKRDHNSNPHLPHLAPKGMDLLRENAAAMSFSPNGKQLHRSATEMIHSQMGDPTDHPILKSRFLTRPSEYDEAYCFLHLQLQEFFAGQYLATLPEANLLHILESNGISWEFLEEWRFAAGSLEPETPQWKTFWDFWQQKLQNCDLFGGIHCFVAHLVAESESARNAPWSVKLVRDLWGNIYEQGWRDPSISALIVLDPFALVEHLKEELCADTLKRVFNLMPQGLQHETGLYDWISQNPETDWLLGECAPSLYPPADLEKLRKLIRDPQLTPRERLHALQMTTGYHDEKSVQDARILLDCEDNSVFEEAATRLGTIGGPEAGMMLARQLSSEVNCPKPENTRIAALVGALSASIYSAREAHTRDYLLSLIDPKNPLSPMNLPALDALGQCPMGEEAEPIVRLLESYNDTKLAQAASNALGKCGSPHLLDRCLKVAKTTTDPKLAGILLRCLINGKPNLSRHFAWLLSNVQDPNRSHRQQAPFFGLLRYAKLSPLQSKKLARVILPTLRALTKTDTTEQEYAHLEACHLLQGNDKREALEILGKVLGDPDYDLSHRQQACSILADNPGPETQEILVDTFNNLREAPTRVSNDSYFERALINAILQVAPEELFREGWELQDNPQDLLFRELRNWSEENLIMIWNPTKESSG